MGNLDADCSGHAEYSTEDPALSLWGKANVMGRTVVIKEGEDNLGHGNCPCAKIDGCAGECIGYGILGACHE